MDLKSIENPHTSVYSYAIEIKDKPTEKKPKDSAS